MRSHNTILAFTNVDIEISNQKPNDRILGVPVFEVHHFGPTVNPSEENSASGKFTSKVRESSAEETFNSIQFLSYCTA